LHSYLFKIIQNFFWESSDSFYHQSLLKNKTSQLRCVTLYNIIVMVVLTIAHRRESCVFSFVFCHKMCFVCWSWCCGLLLSDASHISFHFLEANVTFSCHILFQYFAL